MSMTAGYTIFDIDNLPPFIGLLLVISAVIGGCGGSTTGGIKSDTDTYIVETNRSRTA